MADRGQAAPHHRRPPPAPYGRRRCLGIAEQHGGWLGPVAAGKTVRTYLCVTERGLHGALLAASTLRCQGDYRCAAAATVLMAGRLAGRPR